MEQKIRLLKKGDRFLIGDKIVYMYGVIGNAVFYYSTKSDVGSQYYNMTNIAYCEWIPQKAEQ